MSKQQAWRDFLKAHTYNPYERQRIANELGVSPVTVTRWTTGESTPRPRYLRLLPRLFPEERDVFNVMLMEAFGDIMSGNAIREKEVLEGIPSSFYLRVFNANTTVQPFQRFWSVSSGVLQQALGHSTRIMLVSHSQLHNACHRESTGQLCEVCTSAFHGEQNRGRAIWMIKQCF